jgi:hypothetical protein
MGSNEERWAQPRKVHPEPTNSNESEAEKVQRAKWLLRRAFAKSPVETPKPWILHPDCQFRKILTTTALIASIYTVFVESYLVSFDVRPLPAFTVLLSTVADIILACDFAANFVTGYRWLSSDGSWQLDMRPDAAAMNYTTTWCIIDFWGIIPVQFILSIVDPHGRLLYPAPLFLRVLEVLKCLKVIRIMTEIKKWENASATHFGSISILKSVGSLALLIHWWACAWFWTIKESERILTSYPEDPSICTDRLKLIEAAESDQYLCSLYWAVQVVTTTGNGDMLPQSDSERAFSLFAMIIGPCLFILFIVMLHTQISDASKHHHSFQNEVNNTAAYLASRNLPRRLLEEMNDHYRYQWQVSKGWDDVSFLSQLPLSIQMRAFQLLHGQLVASVEFLTVRPPSDMAFWGMLLEELSTEIVPPNTWIYREGDTADSIYLVKDGTVHIFQEATGYVYETCTAGSWFGETSPVAPRGRVASARTMGHCTVLRLSEAGAERLSAAFPDVGEAMEAACRWRMRRHSAARWKIMWQRHRFLILEMAALIPRPPPPWPHPKDTRAGPRHE